MSEEVRITGLDAVTTLAEGDLFVGVDVSDNTGADDGTEKKYTAKQIAEASKDSTITLSNKTIDGDDNVVKDLPYSAIKSTSRTGLDTKVVTGTAGSNTHVAIWNADGDLVTGGLALPSGDIVGTTDTQALTNKILTSPTITGWDGWQDANETWTYASASTFTVHGDQTSKYPVGTKIKWTQATVKYGVIVSSAYVDPATTVTIAVNTDYTIENAAISSNCYSYASNPVGYPDWFNFTPSWTGITVGNGTNLGIYRVLGRMVEGRVNFTMGSTSSVGGYVIFAPPVALTYTSKYMCGEMFYEDAGVAGYSGFLRIDGSVNLNPNISTGAGINTTTPFTWATGDLLGGMFRYPLGA